MDCPCHHKLVIDKLISFVYDALANRIFVQQKYYLQPNYNRHTIAIHDFNQNITDEYAIIYKTDIDKPMVRAKKELLDKTKYTIVCDDYLDGHHNKLHGKTVKIINNKDIYAAMGHGVYNWWVSQYLILTDDFINEVEGKTFTL